MNNKTYLPVKQNIDEEIKKKPKQSTNRKIFKIAILSLVFAFVLLIVGFLRVELMKSGEVIHDNKIFQTVHDQSYKYISQFNMINTITKSNLCNNNFLKNYYLKSTPCLDSIEIISLLESIKKETNNNNIVEINNFDSVILSHFTSQVNLLASGTIKYKILKNNKNSLLNSISFYKGSNLLSWISEYDDNHTANEIYLEDRIIINLNKDPIKVSLKHMLEYNKDSLINGYSDIKGDFVNNYEDKDDASTEAFSIENNFYEIIEPLIIIPHENNKLSNSYDLNQGDLLYVPAFYSLSLSNDKVSINKMSTLTISVNSRSRILSTLIQILFNNSEQLMILIILLILSIS